MACRIRLLGAFAIQIEFRNPPVVEVVCGAAFGSLPRFSTPYVGLFWQAIKQEFGEIQETGLLHTVGSGEMRLDLGAAMPWPRVLLTSQDEHELIQLQKDRFIYNWKRSSDDTDYITFARIYPNFRKWFGEFRSFVDSEQLGDLEFRQFELTYVNHIPYSVATPIVGEFPTDVLLDHIRDIGTSRELPAPTGFNWRTQYELPDETGTLSVTAQPGIRKTDEEKLIRLDISVHGITTDTSDDGVHGWFGLAHDWIIKCFLEVTSVEMQNQAWGRLA